MEQVQKLVTLPRYSFELRVERDDDLARIYYQDFLENVGGDCEVTVVTTFSKTSLYIIGDHAAKAFTISQLRKMRKSELADICQIVCNHYIDEDSYTKEGLIYEIYNITLAYYYKKLWEEGYSDRVPYKEAFGYIQGDYARFITIGDCARWVTLKYMENLLFNQPIYARLIVVDNLTDEEEEVFLHESLADGYEWNKEAVLSGLGKIDAPWTEYALKYCRENLEEYY